MMFQSYALFPHLTVAGNVGFGLKQEGRTRRDIAERVAAMLDLVQLKGFDDRKPHQLSGGQRQRVALARALAKEPRVLLLDEPLGALDKKTREETQFELMDLQSRLGATFVVVTHDQEEAMTMADRIAVMDKGRLAQVGTPAQIYEQPASRAIAAFIGDVNLFEGVAGAGADGQISVKSPAFPEPFLVEAPREPVDAGQDVAVAVRPEKITISLAEGTAPAGRNVARGEIWDIGYLGDWTVFFVKLPSGQVVRVSRANAERHVARPISWDDMVDIRFDPEAGVVLTR
jgi:putrescine transport system ATP-binding protein